MYLINALASTATDAANAAGEAAGHGADAAHGGGVFPPFDSSTFASQLLWLAISFGLFYWFMSRVVLPRIGNILEVRNDRIAGDLDQAARLKSEADEAIAAYEQELATAKGKANEIAQKARDAARSEADARRREVEAALAARLSESEARIAGIRDKALGEVDTIAADTVGDIVSRLIGGKVSAAEARAAVKANG